MTSKRHRDERAASRRSRRPVLAALAVAIGLVTPAVAAGSATPSWSPVTIPTKTTSILRAVSCPNATTCFAVGLHGERQTLLERWNGRSWSITTSPTFTGPLAELEGVSCPSVTSCYAVGEKGVKGEATPDKTLIEHWNGKQWSIMLSPSPTVRAGTYLSLNGVSCPSSTSCFAVGGYEEFGPGDSAALAEHWDGKTWSIMSTPVQAGRADAALQGVSCPNLTSCFAVGTSPATGQPSVEHWDGATWSIVPSPAMPGADGATLQGISCPSAARCIAVGYGSIDNASGKSGTLIEQWDGSVWSIAAGPTPITGPLGNDLLEVACPSVSSCFAAGLSGFPGSKPLIEHWNGTSWALMAIHPSPVRGTLQGIACSSVTSCEAVGYSGNNNKVTTLAERYR